MEYEFIKDMWGHHLYAVMGEYRVKVTTFQDLFKLKDALDGYLEIPDVFIKAMEG